MDEVGLVVPDHRAPQDAEVLVDGRVTGWFGA